MTRENEIAQAAEEYYNNFLKTAGMFYNSRTAWMHSDYAAGARWAFAKADDEISRLKAALEKCKEQRDEYANQLENMYQHPYDKQTDDAELEKILAGEK